MRLRPPWYARTPWHSKIHVFRNGECNMRLDFDLKCFFIGVKFKTLYSMGQEVNPDHPYKRDARGYVHQLTNVKVIVCCLPCLPIHFHWWRY